MERSEPPHKSMDIGHGIVELRTDNILYFQPNVATFSQYNLEILKDMTEAFVTITDGIPRPYMCDNRYITGIVSKEEQAYINEHIGKFATRSALITSSPVVRLLVNSYTTFFKPEVPIRLFKNEELAVRWLKSEQSTLD